jgi:hypothetical protein
MGGACADPNQASAGDKDPKRQYPQFHKGDAGPLPPWRPAAALHGFEQSKEIIRFLCDDLAHIAHTPFGSPFIYFYVG